MSINRKLIYFMSCLSLLAIGFNFSIRSSIAADYRELFALAHPLEAGQLVGSALGVAFLGYAITIFIISPLIDALGMGLLMKLAALTIIAGTLIGAFAGSFGAPDPYWVVWSGMLLIGIGWGTVDAVTNPLLATLFPDDKVHKLNVLHAWWPGGIVIGGLTALGADALHLPWPLKFSLAIIPALAFGLLCFGTRFPRTERLEAGVSFGEMFLELFRRPMFFVWFGAMFLTAASELAPGQWVDLTLSQTTGLRGIAILVYVSGLMFVMRHFAGPLSHRLSPAGLLWLSSVLAALGLFLLSIVNSPVTALLGATVWGIGVCYMWPTMLASVSERYPRGGALAMGLMGTAGTLSIYFVLPVLGRFYDAAAIAAAGGEEAYQALSGETLDAVLTIASRDSFQKVALIPLLLLLVFGAIYLYDKAKGGYRPHKLIPRETPPAS